MRIMIKKSGVAKAGTVLLTAAALTLALTLVSCDDFFSSSFGKAREYDTAKIELNAGNANDWVRQATGNPSLAAAITKKIKEEVAGMGDTADRAALQNAGVKLAVESSGVTYIIISDAANALSALESGDHNEDSVKNLLSDIQKDFGADGEKAAGDLAEIVNVGISTTDNVPEFSNTYAATADPATVGEAVMVLALAVIPDVNNATLSNLVDLGLEVNTEGKVKVTGSSPTNEQKALAAYLNLIADDRNGKFGNNPITSGIKDAFGVNQPVVD